MTASAYRLPQNPTATAYTIAIAASPRRNSFSGRVAIDLEVAGAGVNAIILHARALVPVAGASLQPAGGAADVGGRQVLAAPDVDAEAQILRWRLPRRLAAGRYRMVISYAGELGTNMHGLYRAEDGPERALVSQCEATDARAIFPCLDEPAFKATLRWRVITCPDMEVITNGAPSGRRRLPDGQVLHSFRATAKISTYLAALTIGRLAASRPFRVVGKPCRIVCGPGKLKQTRFAQEITEFVLPWYQRYFGQAYPFDKLDQVAVPGFDAGAMENVGAIFYRQNLLLMDPATTAWGAQKRIAEVVAHEIAHQWFGNLVTMRWWDDLWLNEAFATWIAYKVCDAHKPDWRMWDDFLGGKHAALAADAQVATHPVYQPVKSPAEATELFDVITYEKGCAVLRMVEAHIGAAAFQRGIAAYMRAHAHGNATGADLWNSLKKAAGKPVDQLMHSWVTQPGFPLVEAEVQKSGSLALRQQRFFADPKKAAKAGRHADGPLWTVPLEVIYSRGGRIGRHTCRLSAHQAKISLPGNGRLAWAYLNPQATGFFRTRLDPAGHAALVAEGLTHLAPAAKLTLLDDQWAQVGAELVPIDNLMDLLLALAGESDPTVLRSMAGKLAAVEEAILAAAAPAARPLAPLARHLLMAPATALGWRGRRGESPHDSALRASLWGALGQLTADAPLLERARALLADERRAPASVEPNLAHSLTRLAAMDGDLSLFKQFLAVYQERKSAGLSPDLAARYLYALPSFERPEVVEALLDACLSGTVPQEQLRVMLVPLMSRRASQRATWRFMTRHWRALAPRVGAMGMARLVEATGALPLSMAGQVEAFFAKHPVPEAARAMVKAQEAMRQRDRLARHHGGALKTWLQGFGRAHSN